MKEPCPGRRLPHTETTWTCPTEPGDYSGPVANPNDATTSVYFLKPNARDDDAPRCARSIQRCASPPHTFTEEPDGTLTIRASIGDTAQGRTESDGWHGWLTRGVFHLGAPPA